MRFLTLLGVLIAFSACGEESLVRNPFWPRGYEGFRYPITVEPRVKPKPKVTAPVAPKPVKDGRDQLNAAEKAAQAREAAKRAEEDRLWTAARATLHFGGTMGFRAPNGAHQTALTINNRIYVPGDYVSSTSDGLRFTWKIEDISSEGKIKFRRVKCGAPKTEHKP